MSGCLSDRSVQLPVGTFTFAVLAALALSTTTMAGTTGACCFQTDGTNCTIETAADCTTAGGTYEGDDTDCSVCSVSNCGQVDANCQLPNIGQFPGGTILTSAATADNFTATLTGAISSLCFWGGYIAPDPGGGNGIDCDGDVISDSISVTFYANGTPLTIPAFPNLVGPPAPVTTSATVILRRATGQEFGLGGFNDTVSEYEFTVTLDTPFLVTAGECYWIQIDNTVTSGNGDCAWFWEISPESVNDPAGDGDDGSWDVTADFPNDFDMAFCIDQDMGDVADCALPIDPACEPTVFLPDEGRCVLASGQCAVVTSVQCANFGGEFTPDEDCRIDCNVANPFFVDGQMTQSIGGCNDPTCCTLVCLQLPTCCIDGPGFGWSDNCVNIALDVGCVESPLCGGADETDPAMGPDSAKFSLGSC